MCLIVLAWRVRPEHPLIVAANRDEFQARPAAPAAFWDDQPQVLAGRDLEARGTWMGVSRSGRFAAVTNYRGGYEPRAAQSRGALVSRFLTAPEEPASYFDSLRKDLYSGFNLLACDGEELWWTSNRGTARSGAPRRLDPGIYGLGNALLDSADVELAKRAFAAAIEPEPSVETLFALLAKFRIDNPVYGTRCSTVLLKGERTRYAERVFAPDGAEGETRHYEF
jgi:uncharacterized protein with NRDE domain